MRKRTQLPGPPGIRFLPIRSIEKLATRADDGADAPARYEVAFSSEFEVERSFWGEIWREQLSHDAGAVLLDRFTSGRASVLEMHGGKPVGVIDEAAVSPADKVGRATIHFSRTQRGKDAEMDLADEVTQNISVGYIPKRAMIVEQDAEKGDLWRITLWEPVELSIVGVPADPTVGKGREAGEMVPPVEIEESPTVTKERAMTEAEKQAEQERLAAAAAAESTRAKEAATAAATVAEEGRAKEIKEILEPRGLGHLVREFIMSTLTPAAIAGRALEMLKVTGQAQPAAESIAELGASEQEVKGYSYARVINGLVDMAEGRKFSGFEADVHDKLVKLVPSGRALKGGVLVPVRLSAPGTRVLDSKTGGKGSELVFEQAGELIELLRNRMAVLKRGARLLTGLTAPIAFPKQVGATTAYWVGENPPADVPDSDLALGLAQLAQKTLQASTAYARQLLTQVTIDVESMVRNDLAKVHALAGDRAGIHGLGAAGEPTGIYKAAGVAAVPIGGAMSYGTGSGNLLAMEDAIAEEMDDGSGLGWIMNRTMATHLRAILDFPSSAGGRPIWTGTYADGMVAGYPATATNQVSKVMTGSEATGGSEIGCVFGNWAELIMGMFGVFELIIDPYRLKKRGVIEVTSFQMMDILARHGQSFAKATGATG